MQVLVENCVESTSKVLLESNTGSKKYIIEGIFIQANVKNRNGRIYPGEVVRREANRYIKEEIETGRAVGELNHPTSDPRINYERVSHKFEWLKEDGDNWIGRAVVTKNTPMGSIVAGLMDEGVQMGVSTRALGTTKLFNGVRVVQNDFRLITAGDIVSDPSAPDAYVQNLMEGKEWVWANGMLIERETEIKDQINRIARSGMKADDIRQLFYDVLNSVRS